MSKIKYIDLICIIAVCLTIILTILFMNGNSLGISAAAKTMKYESTVFDTSYVHKIDIVMDNWDDFIENCESEEYQNCTVVIDGNAFKNIAIRAKGNTSLSSVRSTGSQRYSFKLEFDHYESGKSCDGLDKLCLNNLIQDKTMMKDYIAYILMNDFRVDSPLCSFAYITVNGKDWGLYLAVEGVEDSFLSRNYGSDTGELYKPDSMSFGGGRGNGKNFNMDDFVPVSSAEDVKKGPEQENRIIPQIQDGFNPQRGTMQMPENREKPDSGQVPGKEFTGVEMSRMQVEKNGFDGSGSEDVKLQYIDDNPDSYTNIFNSAKTEISEADKTRLISALKDLSNYNNLENVLDIEEVLRYFVVHNFIVNGDSYTGNMIHNYYLHEKDGRLGMIPWDYNLAFGTFQDGSAVSAVNDSIDEVLSDRPMLSWIFSDEVYTEHYHALFHEFIEKWFSNEKLEILITDTAKMLHQYVEKDPTKFYTTEEFDTGVQALKQFVKLRAEAVTQQLDGDDTVVNCGTLNLSDMGSMGGGFGGNKPDIGDFNPSLADSDIRMSGIPAHNSFFKEEPSDGFDSGYFGQQDNRQNGLRMERDINYDFRDGNIPGNQSGSSYVLNYIYLGLSVAVLAVGIWIAIKKY